MKNAGIHTVGADDICGTEVKNHENKSLGKIEEVMINPQDGTVPYLVLSYGGIFGTTWADKRFAVPFNAFEIVRTGDDKFDVEYRLNVSKEQLEKAPGFDKDDYPDFADPMFGQTLNDYYRPYYPKAA